MKKLLLCLLLCFAAISFSSAQILCIQSFEQNDSIGVGVGTNNRIVNGGFENTTCGINCTGVYCPNATNYNCNISSWTCTGGSTLTYGCVYDSAAYFVEQGSRAVYFGNSYANPCSGTSSSTFPNNDTSCLIHSGNIVTGIPAGYPMSGNSYGGTTGLTLSQTVTGLLPGNIYVLEFWTGGEYEGWFSKKGMFAVDLGFGNTFLTCKITHHHPDIGTRYIIQFIATSSSHTIKFTNWGHICGACTELVLDDVRLYPASFLPNSVPHCSEAINEIAANDVSIYPNPITDQLKVKMNNSEETVIILYDITSRKLFQKTFINSATINTELFAKGMYLYEIRNVNGIIKNGKLIKE